MQRGKRATVSQVPAINPNLSHTETSETVKLWSKILVQKLNLQDYEVAIIEALQVLLDRVCRMR